MLGSSCSFSAEPAGARRSSTTDIWIARTAEDLQSPHRFTYHMLEWAQQRGRWIVPDVGYYDEGYGKDQQWFIGGGPEFFSKHLNYTQEIYIFQEAGPAARNQRGLWLWTVFNLSYGRHFLNETVLYPTLPLNKAQGWAFDLDRSKSEWIIGQHWKVGGGDSFSCTSRCTNKPFFTITRKTRIGGEYEFWLQKVPAGAQVQLRWLLVRKEQ
jgi:hypothetical protein